MAEVTMDHNKNGVCKRPAAREAPGPGKPLTAAHARGTNDHLIHICAIRHASTTLSYSSRGSLKMFISAPDLKILHKALGAVKH